MTKIQENIIPLKKLNFNMDELISAIQTPDLGVMMLKYQQMVKDWASYVNWNLNNNYTKCSITLYNKVADATARLELVNEYQKYIEFCAILQGVLDGEEDVN